MAPTYAVPGFSQVIVALGRTEDIFFSGVPLGDTVETISTELGKAVLFPAL